jgi:chromosomal replication initiator protein
MKSAPLLSIWHGQVLRPVRPKMADYALPVAQRHGFTIAQLRTHDRTRTISRARHEAMATVYATGFWSLPQVGRFFRRDHTTVLHAVQKIAQIAHARVERVSQDAAA